MSWNNSVSPIDMKLWRQERLPLGLEWPAELLRIHSWTSHEWWRKLHNLRFCFMKRVQHRTLLKGLWLLCTTNHSLFVRKKMSHSHANLLSMFKIFLKIWLLNWEMGKTVFWVFPRVKLSSNKFSISKPSWEEPDSFAGFLHQFFKAFSNRALGSTLNMEFSILKYQAWAET